MCCGYKIMHDTPLLHEDKIGTTSKISVCWRSGYFLEVYDCIYGIVTLTQYTFGSYSITLWY